MQNNHVNNIKIYLILFFILVVFGFDISSAKAEEVSSSGDMTSTSTTTNHTQGLEQSNIVGVSENSAINSVGDSTSVVTTNNPTTASVSKVDLQLQQNLISSSQIKIDDTVSLKLDVSNTSSQDAHNVKVIYSFSSSLELLSSSGDGVFTDSKTDHYWSIGDLMAGNGKSINLTFKVLDQTEALLTAEVYAADELDVDSIYHNGSSSEDDYSQIILTIIPSPKTDDGSVLGASDQSPDSASSNTTTSSKTLPDTGSSKPLLYRLITIILLVVVFVKYYIRDSYFGTGNGKVKSNKFRPGY